MTSMKLNTLNSSSDWIARRYRTTQFLLQRPDAARQRGLRNLQAPRGRAQAALFHNGHQMLQLVELHGLRAGGGC